MDLYYVFASGSKEVTKVFLSVEIKQTKMWQRGSKIQIWIKDFSRAAETCQGALFEENQLPLFGEISSVHHSEIYPAGLVFCMPLDTVAAWELVFIQ